MITGGAGDVLGLVPTGAQAQLDPAAHRVDLSDRDRQQAGVAERRGGDEGAEPDALRVAGQTGQGDPRVGRPGQAVAGHGEEVVRAEEPFEAGQLGVPGDPEQGVVVGAELWFGEDRQSHGANSVLMPILSRPGGPPP
jgi:hypothetical protein